MEHYYEKVYGHFSFKTIYDKIIDEAQDNSHFIEIGSFLGKSCSYMAVEIENSSKKIKFDCVDLWEFNDYEGTVNDLNFAHQGINSSEMFFNTFLENTKSVNHIINPIRKSSELASADYEDGSLDFVFVDGDHTEEGVTKDLNNWYPKLKPNGVMAGDDFTIPEIINPVTDFFKDKGKFLNTSFDRCWYVDLSDKNR